MDTLAVTSATSTSSTSWPTWLPFLVLFLIFLLSTCVAAYPSPWTPSVSALASADSTNEQQPFIRLQHAYKRRVPLPAYLHPAPNRLQLPAPTSVTVASTSSSRTASPAPGSPLGPNFPNTPAPPPSPPLQKHHRPLRSSFSLNASRPPLSRGHDSYLASASGSQTDGADAGDDDSSEDDSEDGEWSVVKKGNQGLGLLEGFGRGGGRVQRPPLNQRRSSGSPFAGEGGRGEHVLVERRSGSLNPASAEGKRSGLGGWGSALFDAREGSLSTKRRPSSPAVSVRNARPSPRGRTAARTPEPAPREPTPPLTLDSIQSTYNPFPLFHIRLHQIPEVALLVLPLLFALGRLYLTSPLCASLPSLPLPFAALALFTLSIPFIALFRRSEHYFQVPFTDERGYRDPKAADDGIAVALALPLLLALACYWDVLSGADGKGGGIGLEGISPLIAVWESQGVHALSRQLPRITSQDLLHPLASARALLTARHELVLLTALNSAILVLHLVLAKSVLKIEKLPKSNTKRFFGFMAMAMGVSTCVYAGFSVWAYLRPGAPTLHTFSLSPN